MRYMMLIYGDEQARDGLSDAEREREMGLWFQYSADMQKAGVMLAGDALHYAHTATTLRVRDGQRLITDGPFAETKEVLGGFYMLEVPGVDEALEWAARCPAASTGSLELRPIMEFPAPDEGAAG